MTKNNCSGSAWPWKYWKEQALQSFTTILLTLFLPLSFLLLLRVSAAQSHVFYDYDATGGSDDDLLAFLFLCGNSTILYVLLTLITLAAFVHSFTRGRLSLIQHLSLSNHPQSPAEVDDSRRRRRPRWGRSLSLAWLLVCTSLVVAELGIEFELHGSDPSSDHHGRRQESFLTSIRGLLFVVGLYETTLYWSKSVVKPVVEDTVMMMGLTSSSSGSKEEEEEETKIRWFDRVGLGVSFGALWWWRLRDHVESLVVVTDDHAAKVAGFVGFGLYYLTVSIGVIRAFTGVMWVGTAMT